VLKLTFTSHVFNILSKSAQNFLLASHFNFVIASATSSTTSVGLIHHLIAFQNSSVLPNFIISCTHSFHNPVTFHSHSCTTDFHHLIIHHTGLVCIAIGSILFAILTSFELLVIFQTVHKAHLRKNNVSTGFSTNVFLAFHNVQKFSFNCCHSASVIALLCSGRALSCQDILLRTENTNLSLNACDKSLSDVIVSNGLVIKLVNSHIHSIVSQGKFIHAVNISFIL